jgi:hypothetical protein
MEHIPKVLDSLVEAGNDLIRGWDRIRRNDPKAFAGLRGEEATNFRQALEDLRAILTDCALPVVDTKKAIADGVLLVHPSQQIDPVAEMVSSGVTLAYGTEGFFEDDVVFPEPDDEVFPSPGGGNCISQ